ncbi:siderophore-interacting protein [Actinomyces provencensis]
MGRGYQGAVLNVLRAPEFELDIRDVAPAGDYKRVRVHNEDLLGHGRTRELPPTVWVRLWIPEGDREHQRGYTLVEMDHDAAEATIYLLHHEPAGPASRWALGVQTGARVPAQLYGGTRYRPPVAGTRLLLVGDPASVPAIADALAAAPPSCTAEVVLQAPEDQWLPRGDVPGRVTRVDPDLGSDGGARLGLGRAGVHTHPPGASRAPGCRCASRGGPAPGVLGAGARDGAHRRLRGLACGGTSPVVVAGARATP